MLPPVPRCSDWASSSLIAPSRISLPRNCSRVGLHIDLFGACSTFTRVAARTLAPSPIRDLLHRRLQPFCYLHDCSGCFRLERLAGRGLHPLESAAFPRRTQIPVIARGRAEWVKSAFATVALTPPRSAIISRTDIWRALAKPEATFPMRDRVKLPVYHDVAQDLRAKLRTPIRRSFSPALIDTTRPRFRPRPDR